MTAGGQQLDFHALRSLLRHRRSGKTAVPASKDYDWQSPHRFLIDQFKKATEVVQRIREGICESLGLLLAAETSLECGKIDQHYAANLKVGKPKMIGYSLMLTAEDGKEVGFIILSPGRALGWVSKRLGTIAGAAAEVRKLSTLETNLLLDIYAIIRDSMAAVAAPLATIKCGEEIIEGMPRLTVPDYEEFCQFTFSMPKDEGEPAIRVILQTNLVENAFGITGQKDSRAPADIRKCIMAHLGRVPVQLQAIVGHAMVPMEDVLELAPGDIIPLNTKITDSIRLDLRTHCLMRGWMSVSKEHYAVQVSGPPGEDD